MTDTSAERREGRLSKISPSRNDRRQDSLVVLPDKSSSFLFTFVETKRFRRLRVARGI